MRSRIVSIESLVLLCFALLLSALTGCPDATPARYGSGGSDDGGVNAGVGGGGSSSSAPGANSTSSTSSSASVGGAGGMGGAPATNELHIDFAPYSLDAGEERLFYCFAFTLPKDLRVTKIVPTYGAGIHHMAAWQSLAPETDGQFDCPEFAKPTWVPLYISGTQPSPLTMPDGSTFVFAAGTQIVVQLHLIDTTPQTIMSDAGISFFTTDNTAVLPAGAYGMDNRSFTLPAATANVSVNMHCKTPVSLDVFAFFAHEHRLGTRMKISVNGQTPVYNQPWNFDDQQITPLQLHLAAGDDVSMTCVYNNNQPNDVSYGTSTKDEMCAGVFYATPFDTFHGCIDGQSQ